MAFHGGFAGVVAAILLLSFQSIIWSGWVLIAVSQPGLLFGRIANFINAELWDGLLSCHGVLFFQVLAQDCLDIVAVC